MRAPPGTRLEQTQVYFAKVEEAVRKIVGNDQIDVILDNIGLPYSGINVALSDSATVGPMDGEILIALKKRHSPTAAHVAQLRRELPKLFPELTFFFQPADIVNQVLNFGQPAPVDIRVSGRNGEAAFAAASKLAADLRSVPGVVDSHVFQVPDAPAIKIEVDRAKARELRLDQHGVANDLLVTLNSSAQVSPNFWINPSNSVSYPLVVQTPTYRVNSVEDVWTVPITSPAEEGHQVLMNVAKFGRTKVPMIVSQVNLRPVFDINADIQGRDLASAAKAIDAMIAKDRPNAASGITITLSGQIETMRESFAGLVRRHRSGGDPGVPASSDQFPKLARSSDRARGHPVRALRRRLDAVCDGHPRQRAGAHGHIDVHGPQHGQRHSRRHVREPACRRRHSTAASCN